MKSNLFFIGAAFLLTCCVAGPDKTVHLKGQLVDMGTNMVSLVYDGPESFVGNSKNHLLQIDENGYFDTILPLKEPTYYKLGWNTLYLTPGDEISLKITNKSEDAEFTGMNADVNTYLKNRLFTKSGSFLKGGKGYKSSYAEEKNFIDSMASVRREQLNSLQNISDEFRELEEACIKADIVNSYLYYPVFASTRNPNIKSREDYIKFSDSLFTEIIVDIKPLLKELNNDKFLTIGAVRDVMNNVFNSNSKIVQSLAKEITVSAYMNELFEAAKKVNQLRGKVTEEVIGDVNSFISTMQSPELIYELKQKVEKSSKLLKGRPAIDFEMTDAEGNIHKLSDFKGKVIYLDFWATWCGPCVYESPYFEKLAKEFEGKDIVFIPISTDNDKEAWIKFITLHKKELPQYNSLDKKITSDWMLYGIPRFIIIDKEFNIVDANAPRPSQPETKDILSSLVK